jgi:hypothetical protein
VRLGEGTKQGPKTAAERRAAKGAAALAAVKPVARRGEDDPALTEAAQAAASAPAEVEVPHQVAPAPLEGIIHSPEPSNPFEYVQAPDDSSDLQHLAHAERQIRKVGEAAGNGFAQIETNYWILTGRWFAEVQKKGSYTAGGHKSVEKFAKAIGIERHVYYRAIRHYVVYSTLGSRVTTPLAQLVVEQLYALGKDDPDLLRAKYDELAAEGPVTVSAVKNLRRLMDASAAAAQEPKAIGARQSRPVDVRLKEARAAGKIDLGLLKELVTVDRQSAQEYVDEMKQRLAEAEGLLKS